MNTSLKTVALAAAVLMLGLSAQARAGGIVFWSGGTRIITTSHPVVPAVQPIVVTTPAPAPAVGRAYRTGYHDGYRQGYQDGAGAATAYVTTRSIASVGLPVTVYAPTVVRYHVPTYTYAYPRVCVPTYRLPSTLRFFGSRSRCGWRGMRGFFWR